MIPKLRAALTRNRATLAIGGAAAVALLAWRRRSAASASTDPAQAPASLYSVGGQLATATGYDSTSADIVGAVQPQIEALRDTMQELKDLMNGTGGTTPIPVPDPPSGIVTLSAVHAPNPSRNTAPVRNGGAFSALSGAL